MIKISQKPDQQKLKPYQSEDVWICKNTEQKLDGNGNRKNVEVKLLKKPESMTLILPNKQKLFRYGHLYKINIKASYVGVQKTMDEFTADKSEDPDN